MKDDKAIGWWRQLRNLYERGVRPWTARVVFLVVLAIIVVHILDLFRTPNLEQTLIFSIFFLLMILLEESFSSGKEQEEVGEKLDRASDRLAGLSRQVESAGGISSYSEPSEFMTKWAALRDAFPSITMVGELPIDYCDEVSHICDMDKRDPQGMREKEILIYRSLSIKSQEEVVGLIHLASGARPGLLRIFHMYGFEWGSWVLGINQAGGQTEVLLNYSNRRGGALAGLHLSGAAAQSFARAVNPNVKEAGLPGVSYQPIELASREQVDFIVNEKVDYQKKITEMVKDGVPVEGSDKICAAMTALLHDTQKFLHVTHLCADEGSITRMQEEAFQGWIAANVSAVQRGVTIRRIFIVPDGLTNHPYLQQVREAMRLKNIDVLTCRLDGGLRARLLEDFSIYDGKHLVYMDKGRSTWSGAGKEPLARCTETREKIDEFGSIFSSLERLSVR